MRSMGDPNYVYKPWSKKRRHKAKIAASIRLYGSLTKAKKVRTKKLQTLLQKHKKLKTKLNRLEAAISYWIKKRL